METNKIEEKVYSAFKTDKELLSRLAEGVESIFHIQVPAIEKTQYPCIVYDLVSCPPIFWSDNLVREYLASFRIWILTKDGNYDEIADDIQRIMVNLGAVRYQTAKYRENKEINKIMDYRMRVKAEEPEEIEPPPIPSEIDTSKCDGSGTISGSIISEEEIDEIVNNLED